MAPIQLDAALASRLHQYTHAVDLCDPSGKVLGQFVPAADMSQWEPVSPEVSEDELDRREKSTEWYSFDEVMARLGAREGQ